MTQMRYLAKDITSVLDIGIDWTDWLQTDTIVSSTWTADEAIIITRQQTTDTAASCYIGGGELSSTYKIVNKITTTDGKIDSRYITVFIHDSSV